MERKYPMAKRYQVKELAGEQIVFAVVNDLSDEYLILHIQKAFHDGDWDYCAELSAEINFRGIDFKKIDIEKYSKD